MLRRISPPWWILVGLIIVVAALVGRGWLWSAAQHVSSGAPEAADAPAGVPAAVPLKSPVHQACKPILVPNIPPSPPWRGRWTKVPPDDILPNGLWFEVVDGIITAVVTGPGEPDHEILGSRYMPGNLDKTDVTRALWRDLDLVLEKPDGSQASIQVLRPWWWIQGLKAKVGATIDLAMYEAGIEGTAKVVSIRPCKVDSRENSPGSQIVIGKIAHENAVVWDLVFNNDTAKPLGVTANHPLYSEDRKGWVPAGNLKMGEQVRTVSGTARLTGKAQRPGRHKVYNMEVHRSHAYFVSQFGLLAHNTGIPCNIPGKNHFTGPNGPAEAYKHLQKYHGIDPNVASNRLHKIKQQAGLGAADDVVIGRTGDVYNGKTGEFLGQLTDPSLGK